MSQILHRQIYACPESFTPPLEVMEVSAETDTQTHGHYNSMTELALGRFSENVLDSLSA